MITKHPGLDVPPKGVGSILELLMPVYWCFKLLHVAERILYKEAVKNTKTFENVSGVIKEFRRSCKTIRPREEMPV